MVTIATATSGSIPNANHVRTVVPRTSRKEVSRYKAYGHTEPARDQAAGIVRSRDMLDRSSFGLLIAWCLRPSRHL
jgi:hypothetical protein